MNQTKHDPCTLFQKVLIDLIAAKKRDAALPFGAFGLQRLKLASDLVGLNFQPLLGLDPSGAAIRVMDEIADERR